MEVGHISYLAVLFTSCLILNAISTGASRFDPAGVKPLGTPVDRLLNAMDLVEYHGYLARRYEAVTSDGYILGLTRIGNNTGPPVLFVNGMALGPELWVLHGSGHDLAFVMSDLGYDVWLGAQRGIHDSLGHKRMDAWIDPEYWDFSHDETGIYDLPAMIDTILSESGHSKIFYVGTSLGGTFFMAMCSVRPDYCSSVAGNVQFVPALKVPQWEDLPTSTKFTLRAIKSLIFYLRIKQIPYFLTGDAITKSLLHVCNIPLGESICFMLLHLVTGFHKQNMAEGWLGVTLSQSAGGTSLRQIDHLTQLTSNGGLRMYDFGLISNLDRYGSLVPPSYNLSKITSPTIVFYSEQDVLLTKKYMLEAVNSIGNLKYARHIADPTYGHAEHVFGKDLYKLVYTDVIDFFDSISGL